MMGRGLRFTRMAGGNGGYREPSFKRPAGTTADAVVQGCGLPMTDVVVLAACAAFLLFLVGGRFATYAAMAGWSCIVLNLILDLPAFIAATNFLYPALALLAIPFLAITIVRLLREDPVVLRLSTTAAVATLIFVPFALIPSLRDALIGIVITLVFTLVTALGYHPVWYAWDIIVENGFFNQIILGCTGILAIAMMAGVIAGVPGATVRQRIAVIIPVAVLLFVLNTFRVAAVFIAVSNRWFDALPDPTGTGDANFFWAHNVIAEALAIVFLIMLVAGLSRVLPGLWVYARDVVKIYLVDILSVVRGSGPESRRS
ncbi:MAG: archaeosortase A [Methanomicrobiales archaeon HGW-Methanomicrobiales-3]|nr:MAG: archaeosortase A [Methanomicrobiales archaeon HGW-Methanomicrobiales-3]